MTQHIPVLPFSLLLMMNVLVLGACSDEDTGGEMIGTATTEAVGEQVPTDEVPEETSNQPHEGSDDAAPASDEVDEVAGDEAELDADTETDTDTDTEHDDVGEDEPVDTTEPADEPAEPVQTYLLHVRSSDDTLVKIHTVTGEERVVCTFTNGANYPSITFGIDGNLYGSRSGQYLDLIDPCTCEATYIGDIGYTSVAGITANGVKTMQLYGISGTSDVLLDIALEDAQATEVGDGLGIDFGYLGSTWSDDIQELYSINADTDELYQVDIDTGLAHSIAPLDVNFGSVGIEWHPGDGVLYACTDNHLYAVNTEDGTTTEIGSMGHGCNNLAAQWTPNICIDSI